MRKGTEKVTESNTVTISQFKEYFKTNFDIPEDSWQFLEALEAANIKLIHKNARKAFNEFLKNLKTTSEEIPKDFLTKFLENYFDISAELKKCMKAVGGIWFVHGGALGAFFNFILNGVEEKSADTDLFVIDHKKLQQNVGQLAVGELKPITKKLCSFEFQSKEKNKEYEISCMPEVTSTLPIKTICAISAATRDFSRNAMFIVCATDEKSELQLWQVFDFHHGIEDIANQNLRLIGEINSALGFEETNPHARVPKILKIFRLLKLQMQLKNSYHQIWNGFNKEETAIICTKAVCFSTLEDNGNIRKNFPKFFTGGNGYAILQKLDMLRLLEHFFPYSSAIKNYVFILQYYIDQTFRQSKNTINEDSLFALLYWPSFCFEYILANKNAVQVINNIEIAKRVLLFDTSDPAVAKPLKFIDDETDVAFDQIISLWQRAAESFGLENIKSFLCATTPEEIKSQAKKVFEFLYRSGSSKQYDLSHLKLPNDTEAEEPAVIVKTSSATSDLPKKSATSQKKTWAAEKPEKKRINYSNRPKKSSNKKMEVKNPANNNCNPEENTLSSEKTEEENESTFVKLKKIINEQPPLPPNKPAKSEYKKSIKYTRLTPQPPANGPATPPRDLYEAIMKKVAANFEHPALNKNDRHDLHAAQQARITKHRFFSTSFSSYYAMPSSMSNIATTFFRPVYFLLAFSIAFLTQILTRFNNDANPYEVAFKENEIKHLLTSFIFVFGFLGLFDYALTTHYQRKERAALTPIWKKLQSYPENTARIGQTSYGAYGDCKRDHLIGLTIAFVFICSAAGGSSQARSIACYYLALVFIAIATDLKETAVTKAATATEDTKSDIQFSR